MATLKYSRQRESIKEFLRTRTDHPTADVVYENMKLIYPNISLGTVYRNLSLLADLGEIKKLSSFAGADHFDGRTERHCHFMCIRCERIIDLESEGIHHIMDLAGENFKGKITDYSARFFGLCEDCLKETEGNSDSSKQFLLTSLVAKLGITTNDKNVVKKLKLNLTFSIKYGNLKSQKTVIITIIKKVTFSTAQTESSKN